MKAKAAVVLPLTILSALLGAGACARADAVVRSGTGVSAVVLESVVDQFRMDLGGVNNGVAGGLFPLGYREVSWDDVPASQATPNAFPGDYYTMTSPRGILFDTPGGGLAVSADAASGLPARFGDIDPSYSAGFASFSSERIFAPLGSTVVEIDFFVPSQSAQAASVSGFGAVFTSVDTFDGASIELRDTANQPLGTYYVPPSSPGGLSFVGISFNAGERISHVRVTAGNAPLARNVVDGGVVDLVAVDNVIYGEPQPVPEPGAVLLVVLGLAALGLCRRAEGAPCRTWQAT